MKKGFTLIELLVVIMIIIILSLVVMGSLVESKKPRISPDSSNYVAEKFKR